MTEQDNLKLEDFDQFQLSDPTAFKQKVDVRLGLVCALFLRDPHCAENRLALAQCADQYQQLAAGHLHSYIKPDGVLKDRPYPDGGVDLTAYIQSSLPLIKEFSPSFFGDKDPYVASHYGLEISARGTKDSPVRDVPAYFHAVLPVSWLAGKEQQRAYQNLVHGWCKLLKPFYGYAGFGAIQSLHDIQKTRSNHLVFPLAQRFPGLEVGDPGAVARGLGRKERHMKIKGVNWLTAVDDLCLEPIGGREALLASLGPAFITYEYEGGVLIQAGPTPQLGDKNTGHIPQYYQTLSQRLKPIRMVFSPKHSILISLNKDGKTNSERSNEWLARFD